MIRYGGIRTKNNISFLVFISSKNEEIEIPVEETVSYRIQAYLARFTSSSPAAEMVESERETQTPS